MIELTDDIIAKFETLLHDHVGYAASRNTDRILADLVKQAEITEKPSSSIPVTIKFRVVATEEGQLNLVLCDVKWKVLSQSTDDDFYTTGIDPKQPNLPGFDQPEQSPKPVVDVKASPEHESPLRRLLRASNMGLAANCKRNLETASDAMAMAIYAPGANGHRCKNYVGGVWSEHEVPNASEFLEEKDDGDHIVFGMDGWMTPTSARSMQDRGFGIFKVVREDNAWELWQLNSDNAFEMKSSAIFSDNENSMLRDFAEELVTMTDEDDALLPEQLELCDLA